MKEICLIFLSSFLSVAVWGQSFEDDMLTMQQAYADVDDLYVEMENSVWEEQSIVKKQNAIIKKQGELYLYEMDDATMLVNKKLILMIDHVSKVIVYDAWTKERAKHLASQHVPTSKDIIKKYPNVTYVGEKATYKNYVLENENIQMSKVEIAFEAKTGFMRNIRYYYNPKLMQKKVFTELKLKVIKTNPSFDASTFSDKRFITKVGKQYQGVGKYSKYAVRSSK